MRAVPSRRPDIFPDLKEPKQPVPKPMPGDPELPDEEEEEAERKKKTGEPGTDPEEEEEQSPAPQKQEEVEWVFCLERAYSASHGLFACDTDVFGTFLQNS